MISFNDASFKRTDGARTQSFTIGTDANAASKSTRLPLSRSPFSPAPVSERGSIMLFAALIITVLVGMIALSIDTARLISATEEKRNYADNIALAALETYYACDPTQPNNPVTNPCTNVNRPQPVGGYGLTPVTVIPTDKATIHANKFNAAIERAYQIGMQNTGAFVGNGGERVLATNTDVNLDDSQWFSAPPLGASEIARIQNGRWWPYAPTGCAGSMSSQCPCGGTAGETQPPCFQTCSKDQGCRDPDGNYSTRYGNSFRVFLTTPQIQGRGVKRLFSRVFGDTDDIVASGGSSSGSGASTSYAVPKFGVLLVDLSRSMAADNYRPEDLRNTTTTVLTPPNHLGEYAYLGAGCGNAVIGEDTTFMNASCTRSSGTYGVTYFADPVTGGTKQAWVNKDGSALAEPQPFTNILLAANKFIEQFKADASPADRLVVVGFYQDLNYPTPAGRFKVFPRGGGVVPTPAPFVQVSDLAAMTQLDRLTSVTPAGRDARFNEGFFPINDSVSDIPAALREAERLLRSGIADDNKQWTGVDPFVVLFTNGLTNCNRGPADQNPIPSSVQCGSAYSKTPGDAAYTAHRDSLQEMTDVIRMRYKPQGITLHVVSGGADMAPHTTLVPDFNPADGSALGGCATESRRRSLGVLTSLGINPTLPLPHTIYGLDFYNVGHTSSAIEQHYFQPVDHLFFAAASTNGWYFPIRPPCTGLVGKTIDEVCTDHDPSAASAPNSPLWNRTQYLTVKADPYLAAGTELDTDGRLRCEPDPAGFITAFKESTKKIMTSRPINLVN